MFQFHWNPLPDDPIESNRRPTFRFLCEFDHFLRRIKFHECFPFAPDQAITGMEHTLDVIGPAVHGDDKHARADEAWSGIGHVERNRAGGAIDAVVDLNDETICPGKTESRRVSDRTPRRDE